MFLHKWKLVSFRVCFADVAAWQGGTLMPPHGGPWWCLVHRTALRLDSFRIWADAVRDFQDEGVTLPQKGCFWSCVSVLLQWLAASLLQVFKKRFWMWHYMHMTCKPTVVWSMSENVRLFWRGSLHKRQVRKEKALRNPKRKPAPTRSYMDSEGRKRFQGTSSLKETGSGAELIP